VWQAMLMAGDAQSQSLILTRTLIMPGFWTMEHPQAMRIAEIG
jgi:hypothetical protein